MYSVCASVPRALGEAKNAEAAPFERVKRRAGSKGAERLRTKLEDGSYPAVDSAGSCQSRRPRS